MGHVTDAKSARVAVEQTVNKTPTAANFKQAALLNQYEVQCAELKRTIALITAAGGVTDTATAANITAMSALL